MIANNILEVYTLIFAWNMYEAIWDILVGTGIALVPFVVAVIMNFKQGYEEGDAKAAIKNMELSILGMVVILIFCVLPFKGYGSQLSTVKYDLAVSDCHPPSGLQGSGDDTTALHNDVFQQMTPMEVYKPAAWGFVQFVSSALTHSAIKSMTCSNNYEFMLMRISKMTISDTTLVKRISVFYEACYKQSLARYQTNPFPLPLSISEVEDIDWIGSRAFVSGYADEFYQHEEAYIRDMEEYGFTPQPVTRKSDQWFSGANPTCREVWEGETGAGVVNAAKGLRELLLINLKKDEVGDIYQDWMDWGSEVITVGVVDDDTKEDLFLKMILQAQASSLESTTDIEMGINLETKKSLGRNLLENTVAFFSLPATINEFFTAQALKQMVQIAGPMILALIQMVIILAAPIVMVLGGYKFKTFTSLAISYFAFEFINAIWAAAFFFDQKILDIYLSQAEWYDSFTNNFLIMMVTSSSIILLPAVWLSIISVAGTNMVRGMAMGGVGGGIAAGSTALRGAASGGAKMGQRAMEQAKKSKSG